LVAADSNIVMGHRRFTQKRDRLPADRRLPWPTEFPGLIKLTKKQKELVPSASITYSRPTTLGNQLLNYRKIALRSEQKNADGAKKCGKCGLCGNFGKLKNMVLNDNRFKTK
jgi:hypothetical protein